MEMSQHAEHNSEHAKDYYELLGVSRFASLQDIVWAYKAILNEHESELKVTNGASARVSSERIAELNQITKAYKTLIDTNAREEYNKHLPKYLRRWDTATELRVPRATVQAFVNADARDHSQVPFAWGTFGEVSRMYRSTSLEVLNPLSPPSMSKLMSRRERTVSAILRFLGIG